MEYTKRYTAAFINVLLVPLSAKMVHQDSCIVDNKPVHLYPPISLLAWGERKSGKKKIKLNCFLLICKSVNFLFGTISLNINKQSPSPVLFVHYLKQI